MIFNHTVANLFYYILFPILLFVPIYVKLLTIIKKYYTPNSDQDDLISIGTIGLIKGISTFKPDKDVRLATYASRCIENTILT